jgi:recombination protein RecR
MNFPSKVLEKAVEEISGLPGIGKKSALRLALHLLRQSPSQGVALGNAIQKLVTDIKYCQECHNFSDEEICEICNNPKRNNEILCIVEDVRDVMAIENTSKFNGKYLVLGGKISPMEGIGPINSIFLLSKKIKRRKCKRTYFCAFCYDGRRYYSVLFV